MINIDKALYVAVVLDQKSQERLKQWLAVSKLPFDKCYCHHMTVAFKNMFNSKVLEYVDQYIGNEFVLKPLAIGISNKAIAIEVETDCYSTNEIKHITLATIGEGKPYDSNFITKWASLPKELQNIELKGTLQIIYKH